MQQKIAASDMKLATTWWMLTDLRLRLSSFASQTSAYFYIPFDFAALRKSRIMRFKSVNKFTRKQIYNYNNFSYPYKQIKRAPRKACFLGKRRSSAMSARQQKIAASDMKLATTWWMLTDLRLRLSSFASQTSAYFYIPFDFAALRKSRIMRFKSVNKFTMKQKKKSYALLFCLVDVNGLEPLTLRTSSECSAN